MQLLQLQESINYIYWIPCKYDNIYYVCVSEILTKIFNQRLFYNISVPSEDVYISNLKLLNLQNT